MWIISCTSKTRANIALNRFKSVKSHHRFQKYQRSLQIFYAMITASIIRLLLFLFPVCLLDPPIRASGD
jgi:hypothetical protein